MQDNSALGQGLRLLKTGDFQAAMGWFAQAVAQNPADGRAQQCLGMCQVQTGDVSRGIASLQQSVRLQPASADALYNLGLALSYARRPLEARPALERALSLDPMHAGARAALEGLGVSASPLVGTYAGSPVQPAAGGRAAPLTDADVLPAWAPKAPPSAYSPPLTMPKHAVVAGPPPAYRPNAPLSTLPPRQAAQYVPTTPRRTAAELEPPPGLRIARGLGWGAIYGQCFTGWMLLRLLLGMGMTSNSVASGDALGLLGGTMVLVVLVSALFFAFLGAVVGLLIGAANMDDDTGGIVGIVFAFIVLVLQYVVGLRSGVGLVLGIVLAIALGRFFGQGIGNKVQQPPPH